MVLSALSNSCITAGIHSHWFAYSVSNVVNTTRTAASAAPSSSISGSSSNSDATNSGRRHIIPTSQHEFPSLLNDLLDVDSYITRADAVDLFRKTHEFLGGEELFNDSQKDPVSQKDGLKRDSINTTNVFWTKDLYRPLRLAESSSSSTSSSTSTSPNADSVDQKTEKKKQNKPFDPTRTLHTPIYRPHIWTRCAWAMHRPKLNTACHMADSVETCRKRCSALPLPMLGEKMPNSTTCGGFDWIVNKKYMLEAHVNDGWMGKDGRGLLDMLGEEGSDGEKKGGRADGGKGVDGVDGADGETGPGNQGKRSKRDVEKEDPDDPAPDDALFEFPYQGYCCLYHSVQDSAEAKAKTFYEESWREAKSTTDGNTLLSVLVRAAGEVAGGGSGGGIWVSPDGIGKDGADGIGNDLGNDGTMKINEAGLKNDGSLSFLQEKEMDEKTRNYVDWYFHEGVSSTCYERVGGIIPGSADSSAVARKAALLGLAVPLAETLLRVLQVRGLVDDVHAFSQNNDDDGLDTGRVSVLPPSQSYLALNPSNPSTGKNSENFDFISPLRFESKFADLRAFVLMSAIVKLCGQSEGQSRLTLSQRENGLSWQDNLAYNPVDQGLVKHHPLVDLVFHNDQGKEGKTKIASEDDSDTNSANIDIYHENHRTKSRFDSFLLDNAKMLREHGWETSSSTPEIVREMKEDIVRVIDFSIPLSGFYAHRFHRADHLRLVQSDRPKNELFVRKEKREFLRWEEERILSGEQQFVPFLPFVSSPYGSDPYSNTYHAHFNKSKPHAIDSYLQKGLGILTPGHLEGCADGSSGVGVGRASSTSAAVSSSTSAPSSEKNEEQDKNSEASSDKEDSDQAPINVQDTEQPGRSLFCSEIPLSGPPVDEEYLQYLSLIAAAVGASGRKNKKEGENSDPFSYSEWGAGYGVWTARAARIWRKIVSVIGMKNADNADGKNDHASFEIDEMGQIHSSIEEEGADGEGPNHDCALSLIEPVTFHVGDALRFLLQNRIWNDCSLKVHDRFLGNVEAAAACYCGRNLVSTKQCKCEFRNTQPPGALRDALPHFEDRTQDKNQESGGTRDAKGKGSYWDALPTVFDGNAKTPGSSSHPIIDLLDLDLQEQELEVFPLILSMLETNVRRVHIGTHTRYIHATLRNLLKKHGFEVIMDFPCGRVFEDVRVGGLGLRSDALGGKEITADLGTILLRDGVLAAVNKRFVSSELSGSELSGSFSCFGVE